MFSSKSSFVAAAELSILKLSTKRLKLVSLSLLCLIVNLPVLFRRVNHVILTTLVYRLMLSFCRRLEQYSIRTAT